MKVKLKCDCCNKELSLGNFKIVRGIKNIKVCNDCEYYIDEVKSKYFVENYKNNDIYLVDGKYVPYWECLYYFNSLEECKSRIDDVETGYLI